MAQLYSLCHAEWAIFWAWALFRVGVITELYGIWCTSSEVCVCGVMMPQSKTKKEFLFLPLCPATWHNGLDILNNNLMMEGVSSEMSACGDINVLDRQTS